MKLRDIKGLSFYKKMTFSHTIYNKHLIVSLVMNLHSLILAVILTSLIRKISDFGSKDEEDLFGFCQASYAIEHNLR